MVRPPAETEAKPQGGWLVSADDFFLVFIDNIVSCHGKRESDVTSKPTISCQLFLDCEYSEFEAACRYGLMAAFATYEKPEEIFRLLLAYGMFFGPILSLILF